MYPPLLGKFVLIILVLDVVVIYHSFATTLRTMKNSDQEFAYEFDVTHAAYGSRSDDSVLSPILAISKFLCKLNKRAHIRRVPQFLRLQRSKKFIETPEHIPHFTVVVGV